MSTYRRAVIHIGTEKTGTTTIQRVCAERRAELRQAGFHYATSPGVNWDRWQSNHYALAMHAIGEENDRSRELYALFGKGSDTPRVMQEFDESFSAEMAWLPAECGTVIFSSEFCHSRMVSSDEIARLKGFLDQYFSEYEIIIYLRRQDRVAASHYTTRLKNGEAPSRMIPRPQEVDYAYYDYHGVLDRWASVFGEAALRPRIFSPSHLHDRDLIADFSLVAGIPGDVLPRGERRENASLSTAAQAFLLRLNRYIRERFGDAVEEPAFRARWRAVLWGLSERLNLQVPGPSALPPRSTAEWFVGLFAASNEALRARWFPQQESLFDLEFAEAAEGLEELAQDNAALLDAAFAVMSESLSGNAPSGGSAA